MFDILNILLPLMIFIVFIYEGGFEKKLSKPTRIKLFYIAQGILITFILIYVFINRDDHLTYLAGLVFMIFIFCVYSYHKMVNKFRNSDNEID